MLKQRSQAVDNHAAPGTTALLTEVKNGCEKAFEILSQRYKPLTAGLARYYGAVASSFENEEDDFCQEAVIALYKAAQNYNENQQKVSFGLYAKICIRNRLISLLRRKKRYYGNIAGICSLDDENTENIADGSAEHNPLQRLIDTEEESELMIRIDKSLSHFERIIFSLYTQGKMVREIANNLEITEKSAQNAIYRIKRKINKLL